MPTTNKKHIMQNPYIPSKDSDFAAWLDNFSTKATAAPATYGLVAGDAVIIAAANTLFATAYATAIDPATRTSSAIAAKDDARASATATVRPYAVTISRNAGVDASDKVAIGVNLPNPGRTPVPPPVTTTALTLVSAIPNQHTIAYRDTTTPTSKAKPPGVTGVQLYRSIGVAPATDPDTATLALVATKSPMNIATDPSDRGKVATYFARYTTRSGAGGVAYTGPFSAPLAVTVL